MRSAKILSGNAKENAPSYWSDQLLTPIKVLLSKISTESKKTSPLKKADSVKV